jgi:hypothetical protein
MNLKSLGFATSIPTPGGQTFPEYCRSRGLEDYEPIEFATFAEYGLAIQKERVPYVEETRVTDLQRSNNEFVLTLETGERLWAKRVVVAVGLTYFPRVPEVLAGLPADRLAHTWGPKDFDSFANKDVVVVGGGSSAMETSALLHEHGARVQLVARGDLHWGGRGPREWERSLIDRIKLPISTTGHGRENWVLDHFPMLMHYLPAQKRIAFTRSRLGPSAAWWLRDRVEGKVSIKRRTAVLQAGVDADGKVSLRVREEGVGEYEVKADHVIAGTGYEFDVDRIPFISPDLAKQIQRWDRAPRLSRHFESSVRGLYFMGPVAAMSFGPLVRFVAGSYFALGVVARRLAQRPSPLSAVWRRVSAVVSPQRAPSGRSGHEVV